MQRCIFHALSKLSGVCSHTHTLVLKSLRYCMPQSFAWVFLEMWGDNFNLHSAGCCRDANTNRRCDNKLKTSRVQITGGFIWRPERQKCMNKRINQQIKYKEIDMSQFISPLSFMKWVRGEMQRETVQQQQVWYSVLYYVEFHIWRISMFKVYSSTKDQLLSVTDALGCCPTCCPSVSIWQPGNWT